MHGLICGTDYIKVRGRKDIEIVSYVKNGLQPYDELGIPILPPGISDLIYLIRELGYDIECIEMDFPEFKDGNITNDDRHSILSAEKSDTEFSKKIYYWAGNTSEVKEEYELKKIQLELSENKLNKYYQLPCWNGYQLPVKAEDKKFVINELLNALYKWEDIIELEKKLGLEDIFELEKGRRSEDEKVIENAFENAIIRKGVPPDVTWEVWFKNKELNPIIGLDGMTYIANLLLKPGHYIHVTNLCNSVNPSIIEAMIEGEDLTDSLNKGAMHISTLQDDRIDDKGKQNLKNKLQDLKETMDDNELPEYERINASVEHGKMIKSIKSVYGNKALQRNAPRKVNEVVKKDMDRVKKAINRTFEKIQEQSPDLADYLILNIKTGSVYSFIDKDTPWQISL
jgi:hypothetical protein